MHKYKRACLLDLPVKIYDRDGATGSSRIQETYIKERKALKEATEIRPFIRRWRNLWLLRPGSLLHRAAPGSWYHYADAPLLWDEKAMLAGHFDAKRVLARVLQQPAEGPLRMNPDELEWKICSHLCLPGPLLSAFHLSHHYGIGHDLALVRLFLDSYPEHYNRLRGNERDDGTYLLSFSEEDD